MVQEIEMLLSRFLTYPNVSISPINGALGVNVVKDGGLIVVELLIPMGVLEWSVSVRDMDNKEVVSDWMDHYQVAEETQEQLAQEMRTEIEHLLDTVVGSEVRIASRHRRSWLPFWGAKISRVLEVKAGKEWKQVVPFGV